MAAALLAGCTSDEGSADTDAAATPLADPSDASDSASPEPDGVLIERPLYTVRIPQGWSDVGDQAMIDQDENSLRSRDNNAGISYPTANLTFYADPPFPTIQGSSRIIMGQVKDINPKIKRVADTTFAGEKAIHTVGPADDPGSWFQGFDFLHDGYLVEVRIDSPRGKAATQKIVDLVRSTWEWK